MAERSPNEIRYTAVALTAMTLGLLWYNQDRVVPRWRAIGSLNQAIESGNLKDLQCAMDRFESLPKEVFWSLCSDDRQWYKIWTCVCAVLDLPEEQRSDERRLLQSTITLFKQMAAIEVRIQEISACVDLIVTGDRPDLIEHLDVNNVPQYLAFTFKRLDKGLRRMPMGESFNLETELRRFPPSTVQDLPSPSKSISPEKVGRTLLMGSLVPVAVAYAVVRSVSEAVSKLREKKLSQTELLGRFIQQQDALSDDQSTDYSDFVELVKGLYPLLSEANRKKLLDQLP